MAACGSQTAPTATPSLWVIPPELDGTTWTLVELNGQPPLGGTTITLSFAGGKASGNAGCNSYREAFTLDPTPLPSGTFEITVMACYGVAGLMEKENAYVDAMQHAAHRGRTADLLEFLAADGKLTLVFKVT